MEKQLRGVNPVEDWEFLRRMAGIPAKPIQVPQFSGTTLAFKGRCIGIGVAMLNGSTTGGTLTVFDGEDSNGKDTGEYGFAANNTLKQTFGLVGLLYEIGVFLSITSGTLKGSLWVIPLSGYSNTPPVG